MRDGEIIKSEGKAEMIDRRDTELVKERHDESVRILKEKVHNLKYDDDVSYMCLFMRPVDKDNEGTTLETAVMGRVDPCMTEPFKLAIRKVLEDMKDGKEDVDKKMFKDMMNGLMKGMSDDTKNHGRNE